MGWAEMALQRSYMCGEGSVGLTRDSMLPHLYLPTRMLQSKI